MSDLIRWEEIGDGAFEGHIGEITFFRVAPAGFHALLAVVNLDSLGLDAETDPARYTVLLDVSLTTVEAAKAAAETWAANFLRRLGVAQQ
jgi:hypothetical protein